MPIRQYDYSKLAKYYDLVELGGGEGPMTTEFLDKILKKNNVKLVLDMTCGTGAQIIGLAKKGYNVTASDINKKMLKIAKKKAKKNKLKIKFHKGDIRTSKYGEFDAVIAMFNAIGHLGKKDFDKAIKNVSSNLKEGGIFIFDIFNLDFMKKGGFIKHKFIDVALQEKNLKFVRFNKNKMDFDKGLLQMNQELFIQKDMKKPEIYKEKWDMQIYSPNQLKDLLGKNGFKVIKFYGLYGKKFIKSLSLHILVVSKKRG